MSTGFMLHMIVGTSSPCPVARIEEGLITYTFKTVVA